jgi:tryptophan-rich sensory protein
MRTRDIAAAGGLLGAVAATAAAGMRFGLDDGATRRWYRELEKPVFTPPDRVFPVVWTALYAAMAASAWRIARRPPSPARRRALGLWATQLALNAAWTPLFFGARRPRAALGDLTALLGALGAYTATAARVDRPAAWLMAPYLGWSLFAFALNAEIARRNPPR